MNKNAVIEAAKNVLERIKCQQFVPVKDQGQFKENVDLFLTNGCIVDGEILSIINGIVIQIARESVYLRGEKDKNHFVDIVEFMLIHSSRLSSSLGG